MSSGQSAFLIITTCRVLVIPTVCCCCSSYFEGGVSSVYLWDLDHGFAGVILIKKAGDGSKKIKGCWDSIHVVEVQVRHWNWRSSWGPVCPQRAAWLLHRNILQLLTSWMCSVQEKSSGRSAHYKLTSTVMLWLQTTKSGSGTMNLGGSLTRQVWCSAAQVTDDVFWELRRLETV